MGLGLGVHLGGRLMVPTPPCAPSPPTPPPPPPLPDLADYYGNQAGSYNYSNGGGSSANSSSNSSSFGPWRVPWDGLTWGAGPGGGGSWGGQGPGAPTQLPAELDEQLGQASELLVAAVLQALQDPLLLADWSACWRASQMQLPKLLSSIFMLYIGDKG